MVKGNTGTDLDEIVRIIQEDRRLQKAFSDKELEDAAKAAKGLNEMIYQGAKSVGALKDGKIDKGDVRDINAWIRGDDFRLNKFMKLHGDEDSRNPDGFQAIDGVYTEERLFGKSATNKVADHIYAIGYELKGKYDNRFDNEDGAFVGHVADYLDGLIFG